MKASELRIGNWVNQIEHKDSENPFEHPIQFDESNWYRIGECIEFLEDFKPIPLTEEWLNKEPYKVKEWKGNGADYQPETSKTKQVYYYLLEDIYLVFETWSWRKIEQDEWDNELSVFVDYYGDRITLRKKEVHILQNLIHALTGVEIELKQ